MQFTKRKLVLGIFILIILVISITIPIFFADYNAVSTHQTEDNQTPDRLRIMADRGPKEITVIEPPADNGNGEDTEDTDSQTDDSATDTEVEAPDNQTDNPDNPALDPNENTDQNPDNTEQLPDIELTDDVIQQLIEENKDDIEEEDLEAGTAILEKLDSDYLASLTEDGLTEEEKETMKEYLQSVLTEEEYQDVLELIGKYIGQVQ